VAAAEPARTAGDVDAVLASLPVSLSSAGDETANLVAIGGGTGWGSALERARAGGARGAVVLSPGPETTRTDLLVVLDREFAGRPGVNTARAAVAETGKDALLEVRSTVAPATKSVDVVLEQLALVRAVSGSPVANARLVQGSTNGYVVRGQSADGREVLLTAERTTATAPQVTVRVIGATCAVAMTIPQSLTARPMNVVVTDSSGARLLPTQWETSHRAAWRRLRDAVTGGSVPTELDDHVADVSVLKSCLPALLS